MQKLRKATTRVVCMALVVVMMMGIIPTSAFASIDEPLTGSTGSGWDDLGGNTNDVSGEDQSGDLTNDSSSGVDAPSAPTRPAPTRPYPAPSDPSDSENPDESSGGNEDGNVDAGDLPSVDDEGNPVDSGTPPATSGTTDPSLGMSGDGSHPGETNFEWAENLAASMDNLVNSIQVRSADSAGPVGSSPIMWGGGDIWIGNDTNPANSRYLGSGTVFKMTLGGVTAFCGEFNGVAAAGNYGNGTEGSNAAIKQVLANFDASSKGEKEFLAAQVKIWSILVGRPIHTWGGSGANVSVANGTADASKIKYWTHTNVGSNYTQMLITYTNDEPIIPPDEEDGDYEIVINKKILGTNAPLGGATFTIRHTEKGVITTKTVPASGTLTVKVPYAGTYIVEETGVPVGYLMPADPDQDCFVDDDNPSATLTFFNTPFTGVEVTKVDAKTGARLANASIQIEHISSGVVYSETTGSDGVARFSDVEPGSYYVQEVAAPQGYVLNGTRYPVELRPNEVATITIENEPWTGIQVTKVDASTGQKLAGAIIKLKHTITGIEYTETTKADGIAYFGLVPPGAYHVQEIQAPHGYVLNDTIYPLELQSGLTASLTIANDRKDGLYIKKVDPNGKPIAGAVFELRRGSGQVLLRETTDQNGLIYRGYLTTDTYVIEEVQAPEGYIMDPNNPQSIFIDETDDNKEYIVTFVNQKKPSIEIVKVDAENPSKFLANAHFRISRQGGSESFDIYTGKNGKGLLENLEVGVTYVIEEIQAPDGYVNSGYKETIVLEEGKVHTVTISNSTKPGVKLIKRDADTGKILFGATFRLSWNGGANHQDFTTDVYGEANLSELAPGTYTLKEIKAPTGYILDETESTVIIKAGEDVVIERTNSLKPSLNIIKKDKKTGALLEGATFRISWNNGADYRDVTTKANGEAIVSDLNAGWYTIVETKAPVGYLLDATPTQIMLEAGKTTPVELFNEAKPSLSILKVDNVTKTPLQYAKFKIEQKTDAGTILIGEYVSDADGIILLENILPGRYLVTEIAAPDGYNIDTTTHEVTIEYGQAYKLEITNTPQSPIYIQKVDEKGNPLIGAKFKIATMNGSMVATVTTGRTGYAIVPYVVPGWYVVEEIQAPDGYILSNTPVNVEVKSGRPAQVEFVNYAKPGMRILKLDADTREPLIGAKFKVAHASGELVGEYTTDINGLVQLTDLPTGAYVVTELRAPDGYVLDVTPTTVNLEAGKTTAIELYNTAKPGLQLIKKDIITGLPVGGARFNVTFLQNGAKKDLGSYTTSENGTFFVPDLVPGYYIVTETKAADGYILDSTPREVYVEGGKLNTIEVFNTPYSDLRLVKIDSETRAPLEGAIFKLFDVKRLEIGTYTSTALGEIYISGLPSGTYFIQEVKAPAGYVLDNTVRQIELIGGKTTTVEVKNTALGSLRILKIDADTKKPLYGAKFTIYDNSDALLGEFTTDQNGVITLGRNLKPGKYKIREITAPDGYVLDTTVRTVTIKEGETTEIEITNIVLSSLRIIKIDEDTKKALYGATFLLYDMKDNIVGEYTTDQKGEIVIDKKLIAGKYKVKEIKAPDGYVLSDKIITIDVKPGVTTEIEIKNELKVGNIQIVKVSDSKNSITKNKAGDGLKGAIFEIFDEKLNLVDKIETDSNGLATSIDLPLGKYVIKEVKAPKYYFTDGKPLYAEIKVHGDLIRFKVENTPEEIEVTVEKRGVVETMAGEVIRYTFSNIANQSNCELDDFFWRDMLPTDAIRIQSLNTGTWNERGTYELWVKTNLKGWKRIKSNLHTNVEYTINLTPSALGLASNEYVTEYKVEFGTVAEGFTSVKDPFIEVKVNSGLPQGYRFVNNTEVGGNRNKEWTYARDSWITVIYKPGRKLPRTGGPNFFAEYPEYLKYLED